MKHLFLFCLISSLLTIEGVAQVPQPPGLRTIEGVVKGIRSSNDMRGELRNYDIIIKVGDIDYDCHVYLNPPYSLFGRTISNEKDLWYLHGKRVRAALSSSGIQDGVSNENGVEKSFKEGYGYLEQLTVIDAGEPPQRSGSGGDTAKVIKGTVVEVGHPRAGGTVQLRSNGKLYQFSLGTINNRALPNTLIRAWEKALNKLQPGDPITIEYTELNAYPDITYGAALRIYVNASSTPNSSITSKLPLVEQAQVAARDYFERNFSRCGDSYFSAFSNYDEQGINQYRSPKFVISRTNQITEADRLNGVKWAGQVNFVYAAARTYNRNWSPWKNYNQWKEFTFDVIKIGNDWQVESAQTPRFRIYQKVSCSSVPR